MTDLAEALVQECESCRLQAYLDTRGIPTIGWGHTAGVFMGMTCTQEQADAWLIEDMAAARVTAAWFPHYADMNDVQQAALISMCYQMGDKPLDWPNFMTALTARDYAAAQAAGLDSDWARTQTPSRAKREMEMLATGQWVNA